MSDQPSLFKDPVRQSLMHLEARDGMPAMGVLVTDGHVELRVGPGMYRLTRGRLGALIAALRWADQELRENEP